MNTLFLGLNFLFLSPNSLNQIITKIQIDPWESILDFLSPILDPIFSIWENYTLRVTIMSTIIWSVLIISGLVFIVLESPSIIPIFTGTQQKRTYRAPQTQSTRQHPQERPGTQQRPSRRTERKETQKIAAEDDTGVNVISTIKKHYDKMVLKVKVTNGSDTKIDMVVVDLELPQDIETDIGSFRMQRVGSIDSGQSETVEFALKSLGGELQAIGGHVEFLGASYEVSKVKIPAPVMEE